MTLRAQRSHIALCALAALMLVLLAAACGGERGPGRVTVIGDGAGLSGRPAALPDPVADPWPASTGAPVGSLSGYQHTVEVVLGEWFISAGGVPLPAGPTRIVARNEGGVVHELVVMRAISGAEQLLAEIDDLGAGEAREMVVDLSPGPYLFLCLIVEVREGEVQDHLALGMRLEVSVE